MQSSGYTRAGLREVGQQLLSDRYLYFLIQPQSLCIVAHPEEQNANARELVTLRNSDLSKVLTLCVLNQVQRDQMSIGIAVN
jgi:hypothetical protein